MLSVRLNKTFPTPMNIIYANESVRPDLHFINLPLSPTTAKLEQRKNILQANEMTRESVRNLN